MTEDLERQVNALRQRLSDLQCKVLSAATDYEAAAEGYRDVIAQLARRFRAIEAALREGDTDLALAIASEQGAHLERGDSAPTRTRM